MMNDYLDTLNKLLRHMSEQEKQEIMADYREHFEIGLESGKSEEQIASALGDPSQAAKMYTAIGATNKARDSKNWRDALHMVRAIIRYKVGGGLLMASLYFAGLCCMVTLFATSVGVAIAGLAAGAIGVMEFVQGYAAYGFLGLFAGLVLVCGGILAFVGNIKLWKLSIGNFPRIGQRIMKKETGEII